MPLTPSQLVTAHALLRRRGRLAWVASEIGCSIGVLKYELRRETDRNAQSVPNINRVTLRDGPPEELIVDRERRVLAPRSLTSIICGDPAPGQSALDRRQTALVRN